MGLYSKLFGPSEFQIEIQRANSLRWLFVLEGIRDLEYSYGKSFAKSNFINSMVVFDFRTGVVKIENELANEVFESHQRFQIVKNQFVGDELVFYLSFFGEIDIIMTCTIKRSTILFEGTRKSWYVTIRADSVKTHMLA